MLFAIKSTINTILDDDGIIQSEYTIEEIRGMVSEEQNELYEQDKADQEFEDSLVTDTIFSCSSIRLLSLNISLSKQSSQSLKYLSCGHVLTSSKSTYLISSSPFFLFKIT
jgi:hypothetical protein